jgi:nucleoid-associated protein YgaU
MSAAPAVPAILRPAPAPADGADGHVASGPFALSGAPRGVAPRGNLQLVRGGVAGSSPVRSIPGLAPTSTAQAWRRRLGAAVLAMSMLVLVATGIVGLVAADVGPALLPVTQSTVVVEPGDTLWDLARTHAPPGVATDVFVGQLQDANALQGTTLRSWQVLVVPGA